MSSYLQFNSVEKRYGSVTALAGVSLDIPRGSVLALLGPNGAGKSTLFGCLLGFTRITAGEILWQGRPIHSSVLNRFGYVSERVALYPHRSVWDNGTYFSRIKGCAEQDFERQLQRVGLDYARDRKVCQLSKGMLQRLGLAIALCGEPEILVLDEPFNGLDPALLEELQTILRRENERGTTLLISTHTMSAIEPLASHVAILLMGKLVAFGTLDELRNDHGETDSLEIIYHRIARQNRSKNVEVRA